MIPLLKVSDYQIITSRSLTKNEIEVIYMIPITESEEKKLDDGSLYWKRGDYEFAIDKRDILCYGPIDFHTNSDDYHVIENMKFLDHLTLRGFSIPSNYDYENHCCYSERKRYRYYDTVNPAKVTQFIHGSLGRPERCCIFKKTKRMFVNDVKRIYL